MNAQKSLVGVQKKVKVLLYKYSSESAIYKLLNTPGSDPETTGDKSLVFSPPGTDPTDLEVSSGVVSRELNSGAAIVRLPYDSWFSRFFGSANQDTEAADLFSSAESHILPTVQDFYKNITSLLCSANSLSWRKMFTKNYLANFGKVATALRDKLLIAMNEVINLVIAAGVNTETLSRVVVQYDISPYLVKRVHITASTEFNNNVKLTLAVDPMAVSSDMGNTYLSSSGRYANTVSKQDNKLVDIAENDIIEVRVLYTGVRDGLLKEGKFIDANGYERVFIGYVSGSRRSKMYNQVETVDVDCYGLSKLLETSYVSFDPSMREQAMGPAALFENGAEIDAPEFRGLNNNFSGQSLEEVFDRAIRSLALASASNKKLTASAELNPAEADSPAPSKNLDMITYRMNPGDVLPSSPSANETLHFSFQFARHVPFLLYLAKAYADYEPGVDNTGRYAEVIGTAERAQLKAFNLLAANAFRLWYSEMKSFSEVIGMIRQSSHMEIFEDRPAVLRLRPPKYNIINFNKKISDFEGEEPVPAGGSRPYIEVPLISDNAITQTEKLIADYAIDPAQIIDISFQRKDPDIQTRTDATMQIPIAGELSQGYTSHFTDLGLLVKYGLRMRSPVSNPFCLSETLCAMVASFSQAVSNAKTRSCSLTLRDDREYRPGRLYYIPMNAAKVNDPSGVISKGVVGYVESVTTTEAYKEVPIHSLEMNYVRYAEIIKLDQKDSDKQPLYYANFKRLPEIDSILGQAAHDKSTALEIPRSPLAAGKTKKDFGTGVSLSGEDFYIVDNSPQDTTLSAQAARPTANLYEQGSYLTPINGRQFQGRQLTKTLLTQLSIVSLDPLANYSNRSGKSGTSVGKGNRAYGASANSFENYEEQCVQNLAAIINSAIYSGAVSLAISSKTCVGEKPNNITWFKQVGDINDSSGYSASDFANGVLTTSGPISTGKVTVTTYFKLNQSCMLSTIEILPSAGATRIRRLIATFVPAHKIASLSRIISSGGAPLAYLSSTIPPSVTTMLSPSLIHFSDLYLSEWTLGDMFAKQSFSSESAAFSSVPTSFEFTRGLGEDIDFVNHAANATDPTGCTASYQGLYLTNYIPAAPSSTATTTSATINKLCDALGVPSGWRNTALPVARTSSINSINSDSAAGAILDNISTIGYGLKFPMILKDSYYKSMFPDADRVLGTYIPSKNNDGMGSFGLSAIIGRVHTAAANNTFYLTLASAFKKSGIFSYGVSGWDANSAKMLQANYPLIDVEYVVHKTCTSVPKTTKSALIGTGGYLTKSGVIADNLTLLLTSSTKTLLSFNIRMSGINKAPISTLWSKYVFGVSNTIRNADQMFSATYANTQTVPYLGLYRRGTPMQYALYLNHQ